MQNDSDTLCLPKTDGPSDPEELRSQYQDSSKLKARAELFSAKDRATFWRSVFELYQLKPDLDVLEVGAGSGQFWVENSDRLQPAPRLILSDLSLGMLDNAKSNLKSAGVKAEYCAADASKLPWPDKSFDRVISHFMLYHVPSLDVALSEFDRVLRPGGILGVVLPKGTPQGSEALHYEIAFEIAPELRSDFELKCKPRINPEDVVTRMPKSMRLIRSQNFKSSSIVQSTALIESALSSLPCFDRKTLPESFWETYRERIQSHITSHNGLKIETETVVNVFERC